MDVDLPEYEDKNAIDFVLSEDPAIFLDIDVIGRSTLNKEAFSSALEYLAISTDLSNYEQVERAIVLAADGASSKQVKESHISEGTRKLYECRHRLLHQSSARSTVEFSVVSKALRGAISSGGSIRKTLQTNKTYTRPLKQLKRNDGTIARASADVEAVVQDFFGNLFSSTTPSLPQVLLGSEELPPILPREVRNALSKMKVGKAPGADCRDADKCVSCFGEAFNKIVQRTP
ncbi:hypothetical protein Y032_0242g3456 [Ancylostoma ceylanicum]|uniref:Uncharacterized protein n=1 Tax=Ancylostoma ceylanicum TaxID=53326 RepID=A0A016SDQ8_9BILA|nr:hypothetical protein Y032_0242g3456 [Ancylostoma ceylanicum]